MAASVALLCLVIAKIEPSDTFTIFGVAFKGVTVDKIVIGAMIVLTYSLAHFLFYVVELLGEYRVRMTGARVAFQTGARAGSAHVDYPDDPKQSSLANWWKSYARRLHSVGELSDYRLEVSERDRRAAAQARQEEQRCAQAQEEARAHAQKERTIADSGAAGADAAGRRLRDQGAKLAAAVSCSGADTATIARGQAATRAAMVLSELRDRAYARAGELAKAHDRARIAGQLCESSYNALIP